MAERFAWLAFTAVIARAGHAESTARSWGGGSKRRLAAAGAALALVTGLLVVSPVGEPRASAATVGTLTQADGPTGCVEINPATSGDADSPCATATLGAGLEGAELVASVGSNVYVASGDDPLEVLAEQAGGGLADVQCLDADGSAGGGNGACTAVPELDEIPVDVAVSPDGRWVYETEEEAQATAGRGDQLNVFLRNASTGALSFVQCLTSDGAYDGSGTAGDCTVVPAPDDPGRQIVMNPASSTVYTVAVGAVSWYSVSSSTGALTPGGCVGNGCGSGGADNAPVVGSNGNMVVSADGRFLYVVLDDEDSIEWFPIGTGGALQTAGDGCVQDEGASGGVTSGCTAIRGLVDATGAIVSSPDPSSSFLYAVSSPEGYGATGGGGLPGVVVVFSRDATTGALSQVGSAEASGCISSDATDGESEGGDSGATTSGACESGPSLAGAWGMAASPDGDDVYVQTLKNDDNQAVVDLHGDTTTGELAEDPVSAGSDDDCYASIKPEYTVADCQSAYYGLDGTSDSSEGSPSLALNGTGSEVYVAGPLTSGLAVFHRVTTTATEYTVTATVAVAGASGTGGNTVAAADANPDALCSGATCTAVAGDTVTLTAQPASGYSFASWSGADCNNSTAPTCTISDVEADVDLTAEFNASTANTPIITFLTTNPSPVIYRSPPQQYIVQAQSAAKFKVSITLDGATKAGACTISATREISVLKAIYQAEVTFGSPGSCVIDAATRGGDGYGASLAQQTVTVIRDVDAPGTPSGLAAKGGVGDAIVRWQAPGSARAITGYTVVWRLEGSSAEHAVLFDSAATSEEITGLTDSKTYQFAAEATDASGTGSLSDWVEATPTDEAPPQIPADLQVKLTTVAQPPQGAGGAPSGVAKEDVDIKWKAASDSGCPVNDASCRVTGYVLTYTAYGAHTATKTVQLTSRSVSYDFESWAEVQTDPISLVAVNSYGDSLPASASPNLEAPPLVPTLTLVSEQGGSGATGASATIEWSWIDDLTADGIGPVTGFEIFDRSTLLTPSRYTDTESTTAGHTTVTAVVTGLTVGTNAIQVADVDAGGAGGKARLLVRVQLPPSPPTGLTAEAGNAAVLLSWMASATTGGAPTTAYDVYAGTAPGAEAATPVATVTATTALIDAPADSLDNGVTYYFTVAAVSSAGDSSPSSAVSATPEPVPDPPTALTASEGADEVTLSWTAPSSPGSSALTGYDLYEGTTAGGESSTPAITGIDPTATTVAVTSLTAGTTYYFRLAAVNATGSSLASNEASATPGVQHNPTTAPLDLVAVRGNGVVYLSWSSPASDNGWVVTSYDVFEGTAPGGEASAPVATTPRTSTSVTVGLTAPLTNGTTYYFTVEALNAGGPSPASNEASATPEPIPATPTGLQATANQAGGIELTWTLAADGGSPLTGYDLYQGTRAGGESTTPVTTSISPSATSYEVTGLDVGTDYFFTLAAVNSAGAGFTSSEASSLAEGLPQPPTDLRAIAGSTSVTITWKPPTDDGASAITGYEVLWSKRGARTSSFANDTNAYTDSFTVSGLVVGVDYQFSVDTQNGIGTSTPSSAVGGSPSLTPPPPAPSDVTVTLDDEAATVSVDIHWQSSSDSSCTEAKCALTGFVVSYDTYTVESDGQLDPTIHTLNVHGAQTATTVTLPPALAEDPFGVAEVDGYGTGPAAFAVSPVEALPSKPTAQAVAGVKEVTLTWSGRYGSQDATGPLTPLIYQRVSELVVKLLPSSAYTMTEAVNSSAPLSTEVTFTVTVTGLHAGTQYDYEVADADANGDGPRSPAVHATPT